MPPSREVPRKYGEGDAKVAYATAVRKGYAYAIDALDNGESTDGEESPPKRLRNEAQAWSDGWDKGVAEARWDHPQG